MARPASWQRLWLERLDARIAPAVLTVNGLANTNAADGVLTLREAITVVNNGTTADPGNGLGRALTAQELAQITGTFGTADTIRFESAPGVALRGTLTASFSSPNPKIAVPLAVEGPGGEARNQRLGIFGAGSAVPLEFLATSTGSTLSGLNIAGGPDTFGAGLLNRGTLTVTDVNVFASGAQGGVAILNTTTGDLTLDRVTVGTSGIGVQNQNLARLTNVTIANNSRVGVFQQTVANVAMTITNSTITGNTGGFGGAGGIIGGTLAAPVRLLNTIVAGNTSSVQGQGGAVGTPDDVSGGFSADSAYNLIGAADGGAFGGLVNGTNGNQVGNQAAPIDAKLGFLSPFNDGPTQTILPQDDSPAVNAGDPAFAPPPTTDQRLFPRVVGGRLDIGAVEIQRVIAPPTPTTPTTPTTPNTPPTPTDASALPFGAGLRSGRLFAVGAGYTGGPRVEVYNDAGERIYDFFAFGADERFGVFVATGDVNGDGIEDIIVGAGKGVGPHVRIFSGADVTVELASFFAYESTFTGGVEVAAGDTDGDLRAEVFTAPPEAGSSRVRSFRIVDGVPSTQAAVGIGDFFAADGTAVTGVRIAAADLTGDRLADLVVAGPDGLRVFTPAGRLLATVKGTIANVGGSDGGDAAGVFGSGVTGTRGMNDDGTIQLFDQAGNAIGAVTAFKPIGSQTASGDTTPFNVPTGLDGVGNLTARPQTITPSQSETGYGARLAGAEFRGESVLVIGVATDAQVIGSYTGFELKPDGFSVSTGEYVAKAAATPRLEYTPVRRLPSQVLIISSSGATLLDLGSVFENTFYGGVTVG